mmetsp:Transcript_44225/g.140888  ORF Transcript_44225/g.140888 Transcript_44225/m.140888 type:complete len:201 (-) Transcript_44225:62-664(-)
MRGALRHLRRRPFADRGVAARELLLAGTGRGGAEAAAGGGAGAGAPRGGLGGGAARRGGAGGGAAGPGARGRGRVPAQGAGRAGAAPARGHGGAAVPAAAGLGQQGRGAGPGARPPAGSSHGHCSGLWRLPLGSAPRPLHRRAPAEVHCSTLQAVLFQEGILCIDRPHMDLRASPHHHCSALLTSANGMHVCEPRSARFQ